MYRLHVFLLSIIMLASNANVSSIKQFTPAPLPYAYDALEPYIDTQTMHLHYDKHYQKYVDDLNQTLKNYPELYQKTIEELVRNINLLPKDVQEGVRKFGGGSYNHEFFWNTLQPAPTKGPVGNLKTAINHDFESFEKFKTQFTQAALQTFGSGWTWLVKTPDGKLEIITTPNQDTPLEKDFIPIITIDLWEHAYYLKYQNRRIDYINNFFNIINWTNAETRYNN